MNKSTFTHKLGLISLAVVTFALAGCGTASVSHPVAKSAVVTHEVASTVQVPDPSEPTTMWHATVGLNPVRAPHATPATPNFSTRNQGACQWVLRSTGDGFTSKDSALAYAKEHKLNDRRVAESCDFFRIESRPTVSMR